MTSLNEDLIAAAIEGAEEVCDPVFAHPEKPRLLVENCDPDRTVAALRDVLAGAGELFDRGVPVRLTFDQIQHGPVAQLMTPDGLVLMAHRVCRPYRLKEKQDGTITEAKARLPRAMAVMYLDWRGEWHLPILNGIASAPLLSDDGTIYSGQGYEAKSGMWLDNVPDVANLVPECPTKSEAASALHRLRDAFKTFCFGDAESVCDGTGVAVVDTSRPPGRDESAFLVGLLTAVCP